jgi:hypothetical protein
MKKALKKPKSPGKRLKSKDRRRGLPVSAQEALERMQSFVARKEKFVASIRKGANRNISA